MADRVLLFTFRMCWRDESAGQDGDGDVMNSPKEQRRTSDRKCDEAQRPLGAYRTDDFSLSDVVLALSTEMGLIDNASSRRGGQVKKKYLDKSMTAYVMHTKFFVPCSVLLFSFHTHFACITLFLYFHSMQLGREVTDKRV